MKFNLAFLKDWDKELRDNHKEIWEKNLIALMNFLNRMRWELQQMVRKFFRWIAKFYLKNLLTANSKSAG